MIFHFQTNSSSPKTRSTPISTTAATVEAKSNETKSYSSDLLGLTTPVNGPPVTDNTKDGDSSNDIFGYFMSEGTTNGKPATSVPSVTATNNPTKPAVETTLAQQEHDFFNQVPNEKEKARMTKDSILALYGSAPSTIPAANQFMQGMPPMNANDNGTLFGMPMQYQAPPPQQPQAFGMPPAAANPQAAGMNNFAQFGMMQQAQPQMNFQSHTMPNQSMGFSNVPQVKPSMQAFNQSNMTKNNTFPTANHSPNVNNVKQQFGSLNLGNVWQ